MNANAERRGPNPALLLLIPAALFIAKGAKRRRAMWAAEGGYGPMGHAYGHHRSGFDPGDPRSGFRLPPRIEQALDAWHTKAHASAGATVPPATPGTATV